MANYITTFDTHAEYNSATTLNYPNVSVINEDMSVIYANEAPPPAFNGKYKFTLNDSSVVSAECDVNSAITTADTSAYKTTVTDAIIGDCVRSIADRAFYGCPSLTSVTIPNSVTSIGNYTFNSCSGLTSVTIGSGVTSIGNGAFGHCSGLTSVSIPSGVTSIGTYAFNSCSSLTSLTIGSGVTSIGYEAFRFCSRLTSITVEATTPPTLGGNTFGSTFCPIYVPSESVEAYKSASEWSDYADRIQAIP